jgi:hypothetical protein
VRDPRPFICSKYRDAQRGARAERSELALGVARVVSDLRREVVALAEYLAHLGDDLLGVGVVLCEDQRLRHHRAPREDLGEQPVSERLKHRADLIGRGDRPIELLGLVLEVLVEFLVALGPGTAVDFWNDGAGFDERSLFADLGLDSVDIEVDVDGIGHRLRVGVLRDKVLFEEAERLLPRRGRQANDVCVEVLQDAAPLAVDRAVRLVDDD